jgi:hypothetical protein
MSMTQEEHIVLKIAELEQALLSAHPQMPMYLKQIHQELLKAPELVHIMTNEQRSVLIKALEKQTATSIFAALKPKKPTAKAMANASVADFGI